MFFTFFSSDIINNYFLGNNIYKNKIFKNKHFYKNIVFILKYSLTPGLKSASLCNIIFFPRNLCSLISYLHLIAYTKHKYVKI